MAAGVRIVPHWDRSRRLSIILDEELFSSAKSRATGPQRSPVPLNLFVAEEEREQDMVFLILSFNCNKSEERLKWKELILKGPGFKAMFLYFVE